MRYSVAKGIIKELHAHGWELLPRIGSYEKEWKFGEYRLRYAISFIQVCSQPRELKAYLKFLDQMKYRELVHSVVSEPKGDVSNENS